jgi:hypothetical protein
MEVFLLHHVCHAGNSDVAHRADGEVRVDEQAGDEVTLLGCYSTEERANDRIDRARLLPGFVDEPDCFVVSRYEIDHDAWTDGYVVVPNWLSAQQHSADTWPRGGSAHQLVQHRFGQPSVEGVSNRACPNRDATKDWCCDTVVMSAAGSSQADLAANWWEWQRLSRGSRQERKSLELGEATAAWEAYWAVSEQVASNAPDVVALLVALNALAPVGDDGATVGSGELENLLHAHGDAVVDEVERSARQNPQFAQSLSHVWLSSGSVSKSTEARLRVWMDNPVNR